MKLTDFKKLDLPQSKKKEIKTNKIHGQLPIDVFENNKEILIVTPIAGVNLDETEISITQDTLTINGERTFDLSPFNLKTSEAYLKECYWGKFTRSIVLPPGIDTEDIEATQKNHILYIRIPKKKGVQMRIVKIKS